MAQRLPELDDRLPEALAAIRSAVDEAAQTASTAIDGLGLDDSLAPIRKGARIVKEISWRWREIGADSRICDLIDSQVSAIEGSCGQIAERDVRPAVNGAFDLIRTRIDGFAEADATAPVPDDEKTVPPAADEVMESAAPAAAEPMVSVIAAAPDVSAIAAEPEIAAAVSAETAGTEADPTQDAPMTSAVAVVEIAADLVATDARDETFLDETVLDEAVLGEVVLEDAVLDQTGADQTVPDVTASDQANSTKAVIDEARPGRGGSRHGRACHGGARSGWRDRLFPARSRRDRGSAAPRPGHGCRDAATCGAADAGRRCAAPRPRLRRNPSARPCSPMVSSNSTGRPPTIRSPRSAA